MRKWGLAILGIGLSTLPAAADPRDDAVSAVLRCTGIANVQARLVCYDGAALQLRSVVGSPLVAAAPMPPPAPPRVSRRSGGFLSGLFGSSGPARPPQTTIQQFGSEGIAARGEYAHPAHQFGDTIDAISEKLISYQFSGDNRLIVYLENGQEWIQIPGGDPVEPPTRPAYSYTAEIRRGPDGAYLMRLSGILKVIYVRRRR